MSDSTLKELWQQVAEKKSCEAKQKELTAQRDTLADRLKKLEKSKLAEQADVDRLEGHSLAAFFYQVIGKMDEKLDKERQDAYAARVKYDAALHDLSSVDADLEQIQNRLARLSDCESQYQAALSEKIKSIKVSAHPAAQQIAESESRIAALKVQKRELLEAINAGKTALHTVNEVLETLDNAEGWSTWDVMGGGLMADLAKYEELDDAQKQIEQLQVELRRFKTELADVEITADLQVAVDSFLKFADFFFDGLFAGRVVGVGLLHAVDEHHPGLLTQHLPGTLHTHGQAVLGVAHDDGALGGADSAHGLAGEIEVAGGVHDVDLLALILHGGKGQGDGYLALDLLGIIVAGGVAVGGLAQTVSTLGHKEHLLSQRGLAGASVTQQGDIANVVSSHSDDVLPSFS